jgi:hypothetical protein
VLVGLAVIVGIVGLQILDDSGNGSGNAAVTTVPGLTTPGVTTGAPTGATTSGSTSGSTAASTTVAPRQNNQVRVKVYNASGVQGRAQTLTDSLAAKNYNMQAPANLDKQRQGTVVECVKSFDREGAILVTTVQNSKLQPYPSDPPAGASSADCIVIIGT